MKLQESGLTEPSECMIDPASSGLSDHDKLRIIAAIVEDQGPFGTELANFRRRLRAIISI